MEEYDKAQKIKGLLKKKDTTSIIALCQTILDRNLLRNRSFRALKKSCVLPTSIRGDGLASLKLKTTETVCLDRGGKVLIQPTHEFYTKI